MQIGYDVLLIMLSALFATGLAAISYWVRKVDDRQFEFAKHYVTRGELAASVAKLHEDLRITQQIIREEARATREFPPRTRNAED